MQYYIPEEIADMNDRNENFIGHTADLSKIQLYQRIKARLTELMEQCHDVYRIEGYPPNVREQCAIIWVDLKALSMLDGKASMLLSEAMCIADSVFVAGGTSGIRITFGVKEVWID